MSELLIILALIALVIFLGALCAEVEKDKPLNYSLRDD